MARVVWGNAGYQQKTWRDQLKFLIDAQAEYTRDQRIMTDFERSVISKDLKETKARAYDAILSGIQAEISAYFQNYQQASARVKDQTAKESQRWISGQLTSEMQMTEALVSQALKVNKSSMGGPSPVKALEKIYQDARNSGDLHRQRGAAEVMKTALSAMSPASYDQETRLAVNHLVSRAEADLEAIRSTDGMRQAEEEKRQAEIELLQKRAELIEVGKFMDGYPPDGPFATSPFAREVRRLGRNDQGDIVIHPDDSPEVSGVDWKRVKK